MFTLRRVTQSNIEINQVLGSSYTLVLRDTSYDEFSKIFKKEFEKLHVADGDDKSDKDTKECYAFLCFNGDVQPLYKNDYNYIVSEGGKTYANLTYR